MSYTNKIKGKKMNNNAKSLKASEISPSVVVLAEVCHVDRRVTFWRFRRGYPSILVSSLRVDIDDVPGIDMLETVDDYLNFVKLNARHIVQKSGNPNRFVYLHEYWQSDGIGYIQYDLNLFGG